MDKASINDMLEQQEAFFDSHMTKEVCLKITQLRKRYSGAAVLN